MTYPKWDLDEAEGCYWIAPEAVYPLTQGMKKVYGVAFNRNVVFIGKNNILFYKSKEEI